MGLRMGKIKRRIRKLAEKRGLNKEESKALEKKI